MSRKALTAKEIEHILNVKQMGCCVAEKALEQDDFCAGVVEYHHLVKTGRRMGHMYGIPLCSKHHRWGKISIEKGWKAFEEKYGNQVELCKELYDKLGLEFKEPESKLDYKKLIS